MEIQIDVNDIIAELRQAIAEATMAIAVARAENLALKKMLEKQNEE